MTEGSEMVTKINRLVKMLSNHKDKSLMKMVRLLMLKVKLLWERITMIVKEEKLEKIIRKKTSLSRFIVVVMMIYLTVKVMHDTYATTNTRRNSGGDAYAMINARKNS